MSEFRKSALVTGGARRIGAAIVRDLAAHGFSVAIHHNDSGEDAEALAESLRSKGADVCALAADLTNEDATRQLFDAANRAIGPVTLLVNNASMFEDDSARGFDDTVWDAHFNIHVKAAAILAERFANALPAEHRGLIVNIIDQRVWRLTPRFFSYTLSKSALWAATKTMAQSFAPNIRVNAIGPGPTLPNERQSAEDFDRQKRAVPLRRGPELSEFGATIRWMWDTPSLTGQMIALDGGQHLAWQTPDVTGAGE